MPAATTRRFGARLSEPRAACSPYDSRSDNHDDDLGLRLVRIHSFRRILVGLLRIEIRKPMCQGGQSRISLAPELRAD